VLDSRVCRYEDFVTDWYRSWAPRLTLPLVTEEAQRSGLIVHRKHWEWCAIAQALEERGKLGVGRSGCGFAVGQEPLSSALAATGATILATDLALEQSSESWSTTGQHAATLDAVYVPILLGRADFDARVSFRNVDMRDLRLPWREQFDFVWSSCALEHLGDLEAGWKFIVESLNLLKPGGVAVHTTEYNCTSNEDTVFNGPAVIYRRQDIEELDRRVRRKACAMAQPDFFAGDALQDAEFDYPPFFKNGRPHVKLILDGFITTSFLLIITKGDLGAASEPRLAAPLQRREIPEVKEIRTTVGALEAAIEAERACREALGAERRANTNLASRLASQTAALTDAAEANLDLISETTRLTTELVAIRTSNSWRITAPLRRFKCAFSRTGHQPR
jgi:SAM-dependent methyltransferase